MNWGHICFHELPIWVLWGSPLWKMLESRFYSPKDITSETERWKWLQGLQDFPRSWHRPLQALLRLPRTNSCWRSRTKGHGKRQADAAFRVKYLGLFPGWHSCLCCHRFTGAIGNPWAPRKHAHHPGCSPSEFSGIMNLLVPVSEFSNPTLRQIKLLIRTSRSCSLTFYVICCVMVFT